MDTTTQLSLGALLTSVFGFYVFHGVFASRRTMVNNNSDTKEVVVGHDTPARIFIPDVLAGWPWPRRIHPDYLAIEKESTEWMASFNAFSPKAQDTFDRCKFSLLGCLSYCSLSREHVRAGCDLINIMFLLDEYSDESIPSEIRKQQEAVMDALRNPHKSRPRGEWVGGEVSRQFWVNHMQNATKISQKRLIESMDEFYEGLVEQAIDRGNRHLLDMKTYVEVRRRTIGAKPVYPILELDFDIPDDVMAHPAVQEMIQASVDMIAFCNDMISYNVEQMRGDDLHNSITIAMKEYHTDVNGAMLWAENHLHEIGEKFIAARASLPQWEEPLNSQVRKYCDGLGEWVRGNHDWNFESERYLGDKGLQIKKNKWMSLMPKRKGEGIGPECVDGSLLLQ